VSSLTAKIVQTGVSVSADVPGVQSSKMAAVLTGNFSNPVSYTVTAENGSTKSYTVRVFKDKSPAREITAFSFAGITDAGQALIAGVPRSDGKYPIVITVPVGTVVTSLIPVITHTGNSLVGEKISSSGGPGTVTASGNVNFTNPVPYTVSSEDGQAREYIVTVLAVDKNSGKQITGFYIFPNTQGAEGESGIINETARTITVTVPAGTDLGSLRPTVYHTGDSVSPISGAPENFSNSVATPVPYKVTALDKSTQTYMVSVFTAAKSDKAITALDFLDVSGETVVIGGSPGTDGNYPIVATVPVGTPVTSLRPVITYTGNSLAGAQISSTGGPGTVTASGNADFTNPVNYTVTAEDGSSRVYRVTVIVQSSSAGYTDARIDAFYFNNPPAIGTINQADRTIAVIVPWDTNLTTLVPAIHFTGAKIRLGSNPVDDVTDNPAHIGTDFSSPVSYTVTALNTNTKTYTVMVTKQIKPLSDAREITALTFTGVDTAGTTTVISSTADSSGRFPIEVTVPEGTLLSSLAPVITYTGKFIASVTGSEVPSTSGPGTVSGSAVNFGNPPRVYRITAENGQTREYAVTVRVDDNNVKEITVFYFANPMAPGVINQSAHTITVEVPYGTNLSSLVPTISYKGISVDPGSGMARGFSSPAVYTVRAKNGTAQPYTVTVQVKKNSAKEISAISFPNVGVLETVIGAVPGPDGKIPISVTVSGNTSISSLSPKITHTGASITPPGGTAQVSNPYTGSPRNFSSPQSYRITAEDGSTRDYSVSVHIEGGGSAVITGFIFKPSGTGIGSNSGLAVQAVGAINQTDYTIYVVLPRTAGLYLIPTITYIGKSIKTPDGSIQTANPFTDSNRNFSTSVSSPLKYTVMAQDGVTTQDYWVTVTYEEENLKPDIIFLGIEDPDLLRTSFDQSTGIISLTLITGGEYTSPYEWRLDGRKLNVSSTESRLELGTSGLTPGQHEIVVTVTKTGGPLGYPTHYTNKVYFLVQE
jgi:hypothetical protein